MVEEESQYGNGSSPFSHPYWVIIRKDSGRKPIGGELCLLYRPMARNIKKYYQAWELRQQNKTFKEIGKIMGITGSRAAVLSNHIDFKISNQNRWRISNELKELVKNFK